MLQLTRTDLESIVEEGVIDDDGNYRLLEIIITVVMLAAFTPNPAVAAQLNSATIDYIMLVNSLTEPLNSTDEDFGEIRLRPIEESPPKQPPLEIINVQQDISRGL